MIILSCKFIFFMRPFGRNILKVFATLLFDPFSTHVYVVTLVCFHSLQYAPLYVKLLMGHKQCMCGRLMEIHVFHTLDLNIIFLLLNWWHYACF